MGLLKGEQARQANVLQFTLRDIEAEAQARLDRAGEQVEAILADARARAADIEAEARTRGAAEGRAEGLARGLEEGRREAIEQHAAQLEDVVGSLVSALAEVNAGRQHFESEALHEVVELAIAIARRVTKRHAGIDPQVMLDNLRAALSLTGRGSELRVAINPSQRAVLEEALPMLQLEWPTLAATGIIGDAALTPGGCRVFTANGRIDADLETQLDRVVHDLLPDSSEEPPVK